MRRKVMMNQKSQQKVERKRGVERLSSALNIRRSKGLVNTLSKLDTQGCQLDQTKVEEIISELKAELSKGEMDMLLGIVAKCYLGDDYEVHLLDTQFNILRHYKRNEKLPLEVEKVRSLAMHEDYAYVEIYSDRYYAVKHTGELSEIKR